MAPSSENIESMLRKCMDPEVPLNIVEMGLIYGIDVHGGDVDIRMTMTTRGCPLHETLVQDVTRYARMVDGVENVNVQIVWDPPWSMDKMSQEARDKLKNFAGDPTTPAPINYDIAMPQGVGKLAKQEDGSLVLVNDHEQGFMVNQAIVDFWRSCNGKRKMTELVDVFAARTGMQRGQVEKEVTQLVQQLRDGGLITILGQPDMPNVAFQS